VHANTTQRTWLAPTRLNNLIQLAVPKHPVNIDHTVAYRPVARQRPRNKERVQPLLCNRRINKRLFLGNGSVNTPTTIEDLLKAVFSVGSAPRLYNKDPRTAEVITERKS
jgi:hypothetical protein